MTMITYTVDCEPDDLDYRGDACASGDDATDRAAEQWITDQLQAGNPWAWCSVRVTARAGDFEGCAYLGGCSYKSEADFCKPGGYFEDLKADARQALLEVLFAAVGAANNARALLNAIDSEDKAQAAHGEG